MSATSTSVSECTPYARDEDGCRVTDLQYDYCYYCYYCYFRILTSQLWLRNIHLSLDEVIHRIRLDGLICSSKSFLRLNVYQELQICAFVCMYSGVS